MMNQTANSTATAPPVTKPTKDRALHVLVPQGNRI